METERDSTEVDLFHVDRPCQGEFDRSTLALKQVDNAIRHYFKKGVVLQDAEITRLVKSEPDDPDYYYTGVQRTYYLGVESSYRQEWVPSGYGLGELISSISLLPSEELTMEVKTWETSKTQQDRQEELDSKNISDVKAETSDVREVLDDFQEKTHHQVDIKASANWGWGSASASYGFSNDVQTQHKTMAKSAQDLVRKSVNEVSSKRSVKMSVSREEGSEEKTTRRIKNINQCRTLNVNYYQVLKEYEVNIYLDDVVMLLFGPWVYKETWDYYVKAKWDLEGIMVNALAEDALDTNKEYFQANVLPHVVPRPDAVRFTAPRSEPGKEPEPAKAIYAYEIVPGYVDGDPKGLRELLAFLFRYVSPTSPPAHMKPLSLVKEFDFLQSKEAASELAATSANTVMLIPVVHYLSDIEIEAIPQKIESVNDRIVDDFLSLLDDVGERQSSWKETIPTHGIYAETMLGLCSGCEDYYEIQRQFDLEHKKLEIERMKLENEQLGILNQVSRQSPSDSIVIKDPPQNSTLTLNVAVPDAAPGTTVEFETTGDQ